MRTTFFSTLVLLSRQIFLGTYYSYLTRVRCIGFVYLMVWIHMWSPGASLKVHIRLCNGFDSSVSCADSKRTNRRFHDLEKTFFGRKCLSSDVGDQISQQNQLSIATHNSCPRHGLMFRYLSNVFTPTAGDKRAGAVHAPMHFVALLHWVRLLSSILPPPPPTS